MSWKDIETYAPKRTEDGEKTGFYKLKVGDNRIRIVSEPIPRHSHWVSDSKSYPCTGEGCDYCANGTDRSTKYLFYIIDREDGKLKITELPQSVANKLRAYQKDPEYAFDTVPNYDVTVKRTGTSKENTKYDVVAARSNTDLTESEQLMVGLAKPLSEVAQALTKKASSVPAVSSDEIPLEVIEV